MKLLLSEAEKDIKMRLLMDLFRQFAAMDPETTIKSGELAMMFYDSLPPEAQLAIKKAVESDLRKPEDKTDQACVN
jgi:hypothetical protein